MEQEPFGSIWQRQRPILALLGISSLAGAGLIGLGGLRLTLPGWHFLIWNLWLAWVPVFFALALSWVERPPKPRPVAAAALVGGWLLFFPNAPYLITDLMYARLRRQGMPVYFDVVTLFLFAWTGLLLGFVSLQIIQQLATRRWGSRAGWLVVAGTLLAGGFGVYWGRIFRWNSWDVLTRPHALAENLVGHVMDPAAFPLALPFTTLFTGLLLVTYLTYHVLTLRPAAVVVAAQSPDMSPGASAGVSAGAAAGTFSDAPAAASATGVRSTNR